MRDGGEGRRGVLDYGLHSSWWGQKNRVTLESDHLSQPRLAGGGDCGRRRSDILYREPD